MACAQRICRWLNTPDSTYKGVTRLKTRGVSTDVEAYLHRVTRLQQSRGSTSCQENIWRHGFNHDTVDADLTLCFCTETELCNSVTKWSDEQNKLWTCYRCGAAAWLSYLQQHPVTLHHEPLWFTHTCTTWGTFRSHNKTGRNIWSRSWQLVWASCVCSLWMRKTPCTYIKAQQQRLREGGRFTLCHREDVKCVVFCPSLYSQLLCAHSR